MQFTSTGFSLDKNDAIHIAKVLGYSVGAAVCASALALLAHLNIPEQYMFLVPMFNTIIVAVEKFCTDHTQE